MKSKTKASKPVTPRRHGNAATPDELVAYRLLVDEYDLRLWQLENYETQRGELNPKRKKTEKNLAGPVRDADRLRLKRAQVEAEKHAGAGSRSSRAALWACEEEFPDEGFTLTSAWTRVSTAIRQCKRHPLDLENDSDALRAYELYEAGKRHAEANPKVLIVKSKPRRDRRYTARASRPRPERGMTVSGPTELRLNDPYLRKYGFSRGKIDPAADWIEGALKKRP